MATPCCQVASRPRLVPTSAGTFSGLYSVPRQKGDTGLGIADYAFSMTKLARELLTADYDRGRAAAAHASIRKTPEEVCRKWRRYTSECVALTALSMPFVKMASS